MTGLRCVALPPCGLRFCCWLVSISESSPQHACHHARHCPHQLSRLPQVCAACMPGLPIVLDHLHVRTPLRHFAPCIRSALLSLRRRVTARDHLPLLPRYNVIVAAWLCQFLCFCVFWARRVARTVRSYVTRRHAPQPCPQCLHCRIPSAAVPRVLWFWLVHTRSSCCLSLFVMRDGRSEMQRQKF